MPNHVDNKLIIVGDKAQLSRLLKLIVKPDKDDKEDLIVDFNGTVPMPKALDITEGTRTPAEERQYKANKKKYGFGSWYDWCIANWGTKWNAYDCDCNEPKNGTCQLRFNTAWSPPEAWLAKTARKFPKLGFQDQWRDEGGPSGTLTYNVLLRPAPRTRARRRARG